MKTSPADRRAEPREPAQGNVRLCRSGQISAPFTGRLLEMSPHGFRTRHSCLSLASGDRVEFEFNGRSGAARAMWTRIVGSEAETGFNVLLEAS